MNNNLINKLSLWQLHCTWNAFGKFHICCSEDKIIRRRNNLSESKSELLKTSKNRRYNYCHMYDKGRYA